MQGSQSLILWINTMMLLWILARPGRRSPGHPDGWRAGGQFL